MKKSINETGDTIVEVLISLAILTVILVGAYVTANRSTIAERDAQEHAEALTVAQYELETLHNVGSIAAPNQCFDPKSTPPNQPTINCTIPNNNPSQRYATPSICQASSSNVAYCYTVQTISTTSHIIVHPKGGPPLLVSLITYNIEVSWPAIRGGINNVNLFYRPK